MSLGETFRRAREEKKLTTSQVAEATRMLSQVVEDLEREDYRRIAAPIYGRGFIKIYADFLGLRPEPLIQEFMEIYTGLRPPQVMRRPAADDLDEQPAEEPASDASDASGELKETAAPVSAAVSDSRSADEVAHGLELFSAAATRAVTPRAAPTEAPRVPVASFARDPMPYRARSETAASSLAVGAEKEAGGFKNFGQAVRDWLPQGWTLMRLGVTILVALAVIGLVLLGVHKLKKITQPRSTANLVIERVLPPPPPYFD